MALSIALIRDSDNVVRLTVVGEFSAKFVRELEENKEYLTDGIVIEDDDPTLDHDCRKSLSALGLLIGQDVLLCQAFEWILRRDWTPEDMVDGVRFDPEEGGGLSGEIEDPVNALDALFQTRSLRRLKDALLDRLEQVGTRDSKRLYSAEAIYARELEAQGRRPDPIPGCEDLDNDPQRRVHN